MIIPWSHFGEGISIYLGNLLQRRYDYSHIWLISFRCFTVCLVVLCSVHIKYIVNYLYCRRGESQYLRWVETEALEESYSIQGSCKL